MASCSHSNLPPAICVFCKAGATGGGGGGGGTITGPGRSLLSASMASVKEHSLCNP